MKIQVNFSKQKDCCNGRSRIIGSHLVDALIPEHAKVTVFDMSGGLYNYDPLTEITYHKLYVGREKP